MKPFLPMPPAPARTSVVDVLVFKYAGRFKALAGDCVKWGEYATTTARAAAAAYFGVAEDRIEIELTGRSIKAQLKGGVS